MRISNSRKAPSTQALMAVSSDPDCRMDRGVSSETGVPAANRSAASNNMAAGSIDPMRNMAAVEGGTRCRISTAASVKTRQQSISGSRYKDSVWGYGNRSQSPYGPTLKMEKHYYLPIPRAQIERAPSLEQNAGY